MSDKNYKILKSIAWIFFLTFLLLQFINNFLYINTKLIGSTIPFNLEGNRATGIQDSLLAESLKNKVVLNVLTDNSDMEGQVAESDSMVSEFGEKIHISLGDKKQYVLKIDEMLFPADVKSVGLVIQDTITSRKDILEIETVKKLSYETLFNSVINLVIFFFVFFNSYLLLRFSLAKENLLIVFFLIFLFYSRLDFILPEFLDSSFVALLTPFWGVVFYHFIVIKTKAKRNIRKLYLTSAAIYLLFYFLYCLNIKIYFLCQLWSLFWLIKGFLLLRKEYKTTGSIDLKRLLAAFGGMGFTLICAAVFLGIIFLLTFLFGVSSLIGLSELLDFSNILDGMLIAVMVILPLLGIFFGILWFLGSFSWALLTGTALDIKIRSTLIYSIIGILFITLFGLIDYSLGELLQHIFGKFFGSEFIAGIPATIGMIAFFNPIKNRIEKIVDTKLNSSELDFLEKTETFSRNLSEEGVLEGFEEYICENLINRLPIEKVALISYDQKFQAFKFNEVRGSDIEENSPVLDKERILGGKKLSQINNPEDFKSQDISSFPLVIPVLIDRQEKWYLAMGKRRDRNSYTKKDISVLLSLVDRIKLSLKFILAYEAMLKDQFDRKLREKDVKINKMQEKLIHLKKKLENLS